jgi:hypothetical protein
VNAVGAEDWSKARLDALVEEATVDAYDEYEQTSASMRCSRSIWRFRSSRWSSAWRSPSRGSACFREAGSWPYTPGTRTDRPSASSILRRLQRIRDSNS